MLAPPYYRKNGITIYHGDCRKIAPLLDRCDLLLTDPPYGIGVCPTGTIGDSRRKRARRIALCTRFKPVTWDDHPPAPWVLQMLISRARWSVLWGGYRKGSDLRIANSPGQIRKRPSRCSGGGGLECSRRTCPKRRFAFTQRRSPSR